jgi:hypothetical protein
MAKTTVAIDLQAQTKGTESVKSLKAQIREATNEATALAQKFGEFSPQATAAAAKVAELKDQMGDFQERVAALNPDKFQAIATLTQGVARGIQAAQGAMALFGTESEDAQKALLKVQGAMALAEGVQGVIVLTNQFKALGSVAVQALNNIAKGLGRTGIGLLVVGLGIAITELVANWDKLKEMISGTNKVQDQLNKSLTAYSDGAKDAIQQTMTVAMAFDNAKRGVISKEQALAIYNEQLGGVLGTQTDLNSAEKVFIQNADAYVEAAAKRKQIDALLTQAAEIEAKARMDAQQLEIDFNRDKYATAYDKYLMQREQRITKARASENSQAAIAAAKQVAGELQIITKGHKLNLDAGKKFNEDYKGVLESRQDIIRKQQEEASNDYVKFGRDLELLEAKTEEEREQIRLRYSQDDRRAKIEKAAFDLSQIENKSEAETALYKFYQSTLQRLNQIDGIEQANLDKKIKEDALKRQQDHNEKLKQEFEKSAQTEYETNVEAINKLYLDRESAAAQDFLNGKINAEEYDAAIAKIEADKNARLIQEAKDYGKDSTATQKEYLDKQVQQKKDADAEEIKSDDEKKRKQQENLQQQLAWTAQGFAAIAELADAFAGKSEEQQKKAFEIRKKASIAQAIVETIASAQSAFNSQIIPGDPTSPIRGAIAAALAIASGIARVKKIEQTKFESRNAPTGGGGGNNPSAPNTTPVTGGLLPDMEQPGGFAGMGRVYVLEGDITKTQTRVRRVRNVSVV